MLKISQPTDGFIAIVADERSCDVFVDGRLYKSEVLKTQC